MTETITITLQSETWTVLEEIQMTGKPGTDAPAMASVIETQLWKSPEFRKKAKWLGIDKPKRRRPGRPKVKK